MKKPWDTIPVELRNKPIQYIGTMQKINKELKELGIPIQIEMVISKHRKSEWNEEENLYWEQSVKHSYNYLAVMDTPLDCFI